MPISGTIFAIKNFQIHVDEDILCENTIIFIVVILLQRALTTIEDNEFKLEDPQFNVNINDALEEVMRTQSAGHIEANIEDKLNLVSS